MFKIVVIVIIGISLSLFPPHSLSLSLSLSLSISLCYYELETHSFFTLSNLQPIRDLISRSMFLILLHRQEEDFWSSLSRILERISTREVVSSRLIRYTLRFVSYLPLERSLNFSSVDLFSFAFYITNKS